MMLRLNEMDLPMCPTVHGVRPERDHERIHELKSKVFFAEAVRENRINFLVDSCSRVILGRHILLHVANIERLR